MNTFAPNPSKPSAPRPRRPATARGLVVLTAAGLLALPLPMRAHDGDDHTPRPAASGGAGAQPPATKATAAAAATPVSAAREDTLPRFSAHSDAIELVGVLDGTRLTLWLDRFADNRPIVDAAVEIELMGTTHAARLTGDVYVVQLPAPPAPGRVPVSLTVVSPQVSDLLAAELVIGPADAAGSARVSASVPASVSASGAAPSASSAPIGGETHGPADAPRTVMLVGALVAVIAGVAGWWVGRMRPRATKD